MSCTDTFCTVKTGVAYIPIIYMSLMVFFGCAQFMMVRSVSYVMSCDIYFLLLDIDKTDSLQFICP